VQHLQPVGEAVLEVGELVEEHHVAAGAVAVQEHDRAVRLDVEHRPGDRQDRRDAAAGGHQAVPQGARAVGSRAEAPGRREHLELVTCAQPSSTQVENAPPSSRLTATRSGPPAALLQTE
jgi:hypothetical protein